MAMAKNPTQSKQEKRVATQAERMDKFKKLAQLRTNRALRALGGIGQLSSRKRYGYTQEQVSKIFGALNASLKKAAARFEAGEDEKAADEFQL